jgi:hypothetical protein
VNWAGFYFLKARAGAWSISGKSRVRSHSDGQGRVRRGRAAMETIIVPNVHEFPGHIACDVASNSEIVVPLFDGERCSACSILTVRQLEGLTTRMPRGLNETSHSICGGMKSIWDYSDQHFVRQDLQDCSGLPSSIL